MLAWVDENEAQHDSDCGFFIRYCMDVGLEKYGQGVGNFFATGTYLHPDLYENPTIEGRNAALINRSGIYVNGQYSEFDQARVAEDVTHSFYEGSRPLHPFEGETRPIDPEAGRKQGKYSFARSPRYDIPGLGYIPLEAGPLARRIAAAGPGALSHQDNDPLFLDMLQRIGPSVMVRQLAGCTRHPSTTSRPASSWTRSTSKRASTTSRSSTARNIWPRDAKETLGPIEQALVGSPIVDEEDPVELGHVARGFGSCLVCTVRAYDGKGRELSRFVINGAA